ncbi:MAG: PqqD family protein [Thermomonas sp.]|uniref:PqqD family protein n=1 Tax=Thermomonas sp. TaxID=1971895 RepID=UPI001D9938A1|nr:PqqD family protein [Thermomonas sp.]MBZ0087681.1 PqqD family protein [Thermomonas sp.]
MTASRAPVTLSHRASISDEVLAQEVGDEVVLLDLAGERYFGLDPVGTRIWALLPDAANLGAVLDNLCAEFDAPRERIEADLLALIAALCEAGLVTVA